MIDDKPTFTSKELYELYTN